MLSDPAECWMKNAITAIDGPAGMAPGAVFSNARRPGKAEKDTDRPGIPPFGTRQYQLG
jgi:hypothetical protein